MGGVPSCGAPNEAFESLCIFFWVVRIAANYVQWLPKRLVYSSPVGHFGVDRLVPGTQLTHI